MLQKWERLGPLLGYCSGRCGKALVDMSVNSAAYADETFTASTVTGMSTDSLQAYKYAAELVDVSNGNITGSMARNVRSMSSALESALAR